MKKKAVKKSVVQTKEHLSNSLDNDKVAKAAIRKFGTKKQREMLVEECSELIMAIQKLKRVEDSINNLKKLPTRQLKYKSMDELIQRKNNFVEEMADVSIVILQFRKSDEKLNQQFIKYFNSKITRLEKRIKSK